MCDKNAMDAYIFLFKMALQAELPGNPVDMEDHIPKSLDARQKAELRREFEKILEDEAEFVEQFQLAMDPEKLWQERIEPNFPSFQQNEPEVMIEDLFRETRPPELTWVRDFEVLISNGVDSDPTNCVPIFTGNYALIIEKDELRFVPIEEVIIKERYIGIKREGKTWFIVSEDFFLAGNYDCMIKGKSLTFVPDEGLVPRPYRPGAKPSRIGGYMRIVTGVGVESSGIENLISEDNYIGIIDGKELRFVPADKLGTKGDYACIIKNEEIRFIPTEEIDSESNMPHTMLLPPEHRISAPQGQVGHNPSGNPIAAANYVSMIKGQAHGLLPVQELGYESRIQGTMQIPTGDYLGIINGEEVRFTRVESHLPGFGIARINGSGIELIPGIEGVKMDGSTLAAYKKVMGTFRTQSNSDEPEEEKDSE